jgi:hypothetical protein
VRSLTACQLPWVAGKTCGMAPPSAFLYGLEKVRVIGVLALIVVPAVGVASALDPAPPGNQLTSAAFEVSQERGAAATQIVPAGAVRASVTWD